MSHPDDDAVGVALRPSFEPIHDRVAIPAPGRIQGRARSKAARDDGESAPPLARSPVLRTCWPPSRRSLRSFVVVRSLDPRRIRGADAFCRLPP
jgi:hypothetical protein